MEASSIEARLSALEYKLGIQKNDSESADVASRLDALQTLYDSRTNATFRETCSESAKLLRELDAGTALTYQQHVGSSAPLYYRRQEVLASAASLTQDMDQIQQMVPLLLVGNTNAARASTATSAGAATTLESAGAGSGGAAPADKKEGGAAGAGATAAVASGAVLREDEVIHAAILNSASISREDQRRLDVARMDISDLQNRSHVLSQRVDNLLKLYYTVISSISAKVVLADEAIAARET